MNSISTMSDAQSPAQESASAKLGTGPKILFADDEEDLREYIETILIDEGYQIRAARDGCEAVAMFSEFEPDLVILDVNMPLMNGTQACAVIRQISDVPIIMFTSAGDLDIVTGAITNGTTDFVVKSTGISELAERVASHLAKKNKSAVKSPDGAVIQVSAKIPEMFTSTTLIVDPDQKSRERVKAVLSRLNQQFIEVETAAEAVAAFKQHDPDIVITEWILPDSDAVKLLSKLTRRRNGKKLTAIVMSNRLAPEIQRKLQFAGIVNFLSKTLDPWKIEVMLGDCVKQARMNLKKRASKKSSKAA